MCVDHAGHDGCIREVDHDRARWNGEAGADIRDAVAAHEHHLVGEHGAGTRVEQVPGADGDHLVVRREIFPRRLSLCGKSCESGDSSDEHSG